MVLDDILCAGDNGRVSESSVPARQRILEAALDEFSAYGYAGARVQAIADCAQTNKRMLFYYFGDKKGLYAAVAEELFRRVVPAVNDAGREHLLKGDPVAALRAIVEAYFDGLLRNRNYARFIGWEIANQWAMRSERPDGFLPVRSLIGEVTRAGIAQGVFEPSLEPRLMPLLVSSTILLLFLGGPTVELDLHASVDDPEIREPLRKAVIEWILRAAGANADKSALP